MVLKKVHYTKKKAFCPDDNKRKCVNLQKGVNLCKLFAGKRRWCHKSKNYVNVCNSKAYRLTRGQMALAIPTPYIATAMKKYYIVCAAPSASYSQINPRLPKISI